MDRCCHRHQLAGWPADRLPEPVSSRPRSIPTTHLNCSKFGSATYSGGAQVYDCIVSVAIVHEVSNESRVELLRWRGVLESP